MTTRDPFAKGSGQGSHFPKLDASALFNALFSNFKRPRNKPQRALKRRRNKPRTSRKQRANKPETSRKQGENAMQLTEQYRPRTWDDVVGQDKIVSKIRALAKRGLAGRAYWLSGQSGTGKTTIGRLIAADVADPFFIAELDAAA